MNYATLCNYTMPSCPPSLRYTTEISLAEYLRIRINSLNIYIKDISKNDYGYFRLLATHKYN